MDYSHLFWAKLGGTTWPDKYHPVICHLIDVAAVTMQPLGGRVPWPIPAMAGRTPGAG